MRICSNSIFNLATLSLAMATSAFSRSGSNLVAQLLVEDAAELDEQRLTFDVQEFNP